MVLLKHQSVRLFCLSIVFLAVQSDCCHFREHEHSPTTWDIRSINGFFLLCLMSSTFNPRLSQISLNMPTDKVDNLFAFTKLQMLRERETIGHREPEHAIRDENKCTVIYVCPSVFVSRLEGIWMKRTEYYLACRFVIMTLRLRLKFRVALLNINCHRGREGEKRQGMKLKWGQFYFGA